MSVTMFHTNAGLVADGSFRIDRKFHEGMLKYCERIDAPLTTVHPQLPPGRQIMDEIVVPCAELPYAIEIVAMDRFWRPETFERPRLQRQIADSALIYGMGMGSARIARQLKIPYILLLEYDLRTQIVDATSQIDGTVRRSVRAARSIFNHVTHDIPDMTGAHSIHCNGYPIYKATARYNANRLLYLDSRMSGDLIIPRPDLIKRLSKRRGRPLRLLYSGRYERMKGADDAVRVGVECLRRGLDIELVCYGKGSLSAEMREIARQAPLAERITIHDSVPYPELVKLSRTFDVFVCCHTQSDPSCSYLESFGAGLPIIGTDNRMWNGLCQASGAGIIAPIGNVDALADGVERLIRHPDGLDEMSWKAVAFAEQHAFEKEYTKRTDALNVAIAAVSGRDGRAPSVPKVAQSELA